MKMWSLVKLQFPGIVGRKMKPWFSLGRLPNFHLKPLGWVLLLLLSLRSWQCSNGRPFSCCSRFIVSKHETLSFFPIFTWYQHSEFCSLDVFVGWRLFSASVMLMEYWWTNCWSCGHQLPVCGLQPYFSCNVLMIYFLTILLGTRFDLFGCPSLCNFKFKTAGYGT